MIILMSLIYIVLFISLGVLTWRKGHLVLFFVGIIFPVLWLIGAILPPAPRKHA